MFPIADIIVSLGSMILPSAIDFIKKKFIPAEQDNPERTMGTLATTKPEILPGYINAMVEWLKAQKDFFNRDITGTPSQWVIDLRASIRPLAVAGSFVVLIISAYSGGSLQDGIRLSCEAVISNWVGSRVVFK